MLKSGVYEQLITKSLHRQLDEIAAERKAVGPLDDGEASEVLSRYAAEAMRRMLVRMEEDKVSLSDRVAAVNRVVEMLGEDAADERAEQLLAILDAQDPMLALGKSAKDAVRPETSLVQSSLFTGAVHEPQMISELKKEIASADRIDMLVSFVKWSGLCKILEELREFVQRGGQLRVITMSYMGATDVKAIAELSRLLNTQVRISYDTKRTRLHSAASRPSILADGSSSCWTSCQGWTTWTLQPCRMCSSRCSTCSTSPCGRTPSAILMRKRFGTTSMRCPTAR